MNADPFKRNAKSVPVTLVTGTAPLPAPTHATALIVLQLGPHEHPAGQKCVACVSATDIRALLFNLREEQRTGTAVPFERVVVDARRLTDPQRIIDALTPGKLPAVGLRDHAVARNFHLEIVV